MILFQPWPLIALHLLVGVVAALVEFRVWRRSRGVVLPQDRGFGPQVWIGVVLGYVAAVLCLIFAQWAYFGTFVTACLGVALMFVGAALRWWSIAHLGQFFTVYLRTTDDQKVIDDGPYRLIRHPSYSGGLLFVFGWGLCFGNALSVVVLVTPAVVFLNRRIRNEESLLVDKLGDTYRHYMLRTKRLIPSVY
jgi:protein-S-isoprenylcysteine O-methyltransferase Ste14